MTSGVNYPGASTPDPSVHHAPSSQNNQFAFVAGYLEAVGQQMLAAFTQVIVQALVGLVTGKDLPALQAQLSAWGAALETAAEGAADDIATIIDGTLGLGHTATDLVTFLEDTAADATSATGDFTTLLGDTAAADITALAAIINAASDGFITLLADTGAANAAILAGTINTASSDAGAAVSDLATLLSAAGSATVTVLGALIAAASTDASGAVAELAAFLSGMGEGTMAALTTAQTTANTAGTTARSDIDGLFTALGLSAPIANLATYLSTASTDASTAISNFGALLTATGAANVAALGTYLSTVNTNASAAVTDWTNFLSGTGQSTATAVGTFLTGTNTDAVAALGNWTTILSAMSLADAAHLATFITGANTNANLAATDIGALISGVGGAAITDVVALINLIQQIIDALANALGHTGTGHTPSQVQGYVSGTAANLDGSGVYNAVAGFNNQATSLLKHLTATGGNIGQFDAAQLQGAFNSAVTLGGVAFSSLFNGTGQFIGVLNSAATGALNTALTVGGTAIGDVATNIENVMGSFGSVFPKPLPWTIGVATNLTLAPQVLQSDFQQLLDGISGQANSTVAGAVGALQTNSAVVQANVSQAVVDGVHAIESNSAGAAQALQSMFGGLLGLAGIPSTSATPAQIQSAATNAYQQLQSHTQTIAAINGELNTSGGGLNVTIPVTPGILPSSFTNIGTVTVFSASFNAAKYNVSSATSDAMSVTSVSSDGSSTLNILRADSALGNFVYLLTDQSGSNIAYAIGYVLSGVDQFTFSGGSGVVVGTKANNSINFLCDTAYNFEFELNGIPQASVADTGPHSQLGSSYRNLGFGVFPAALPGPITQISLASQAATLGSGFRVYRSSGSGASWSGTSTIGTGVFDTTQNITSDYSYNSSTNVLTVNNAGWYRVECVLNLGGGALSSTLYHNGSLYAVMGTGSFSSFVNWCAGGTTVYCAAGDTLQPGYNGSSGTFVGDGTGVNTYWSVTLANCGTLS